MFLFSVILIFTDILPNDIERNELQQIQENGLAIEMQRFYEVEHDTQEMYRLLSNFIKDKSCLSKLESYLFFAFTKLFCILQN